MRSVLPLTTALAGLLSACSSEGNQAATSSNARAPAESSAQGSVTRETPAAATAVTPTPAAAPLETQAGPSGSQVSLVRAQVTGDVLTVQLSFQPAADDTYNSYDLELDEVSVIDDATAQRYGVLRDAEKRWQASPVASNNAEVARVIVNDGRPEVAWFKFPAPPPTSRTVSINIPTVGPFDGVTVQR